MWFTLFIILQAVVEVVDETRNKQSNARNIHDDDMLNKLESI